MAGLGLVVLRWLDWVLQVVVPARSNQVAWISDPDYIGNAFHLYRHMVVTRSGTTHVWLVADDEVGARIEQDWARFGGATTDNCLRVVPRHTARGYWHYLRSRQVFHTHGVYRWVGSAVRRDCVSLWHGMPIKCIGALNTVSPNPHPTFGTVHVATSEFFRYVIAAAFRATPSEVVLSGLPRCDVLVAGPHPAAPTRDEVRAALGVGGDERLVVWLPTYRAPRRTGGPPGVVGFRTFLDDLDDERWRQVDAEAARASCRVVVKLHPHDPLNEVDHELDLDRVHLVRSPAWLDLGIELYDVLAFADGLISDVSSVLIDWLATTRPVGITGFDPATYTRDVVFPVAVLQRSPRVHDLDAPGQLEDFFDRVSSGVPSPEIDDLSPWLYDPPSTGACEAVLTAVGSPRA